MIDHGLFVIDIKKNHIYFRDQFYRVVSKYGNPGLYKIVDSMLNEMYAEITKSFDLDLSRFCTTALENALSRRVTDYIIDYVSIGDFSEAMNGISDLISGVCELIWRSLTAVDFILTNPAVLFHLVSNNIIIVRLYSTSLPGLQAALVKPGILIPTIQ